MAKFFKVENVPVESVKLGARERYPFSQLAVGQSFRVTRPVLKSDRIRLVRSLRAAITNAHKRHVGSRFGLEIGPKQFRIGRIS